MTWAKDSYGLFDYQCKEPKETHVETLEGVELIREGDRVERRRLGEVDLILLVPRVQRS